MLAPEANAKAKAAMKVIEATMAIALLSACAGTGITPRNPDSTAVNQRGITQTRTPPEATPSHTSTVTLLPTPTETATPEPTSTPEWINTDPENPGTWPQWAQGYWAHASEASAEQDIRFDTFLAESRRNAFAGMITENAPQLKDLLMHLTRGELGSYLQSPDSMGQQMLLSIVRSMSREDLLHAEVLRQAEAKGVLHLSPNEIRELQSDPQAAVVIWRNLGKNTKQVYGLWDFVGSQESLVNVHHNLSTASYPAVIFGKEITVQRYALFSRNWFDLIGVVELPGSQGHALLARLKTETGENVLQLFFLLNQPRSIGEQDACISSREAITQHITVSCPETNLQVTRLEIRDVTSAAPATAEHLQQALRWPPPAMELRGQQIAVSSRQTYDGVLENGLEVPSWVVIQAARDDNTR